MCEPFKDLSEEEKVAKEDDFERHQEGNIISQLEKKNDKLLASKSNNIKLLYSFDLQTFIHLPTGNVSQFYCKSKLNIFNFTVFNIAEKQGSATHGTKGNRKRKQTKSQS